jgi:ribosomal protein S27AE
MTTSREVPDKTLLCAACGDGFVFSAGEQELFRLRGITTQPARCPSCARGRVLADPRKANSDHSFR